MIKDYYTILGIHKDCSASDIHQAYRKLSTTYPTHLAPGDLEEAYEVLKYEGSRLEYDLRVKYTAQHNQKNQKGRTKLKRRRVTQSNYNSWRIAITFFRYTCRVSLAFCILICIDYFLPTSPHTDFVKKKGSSAHYKYLAELSTADHTNFEVPFNLKESVHFGHHVIVHKSMLMKSGLSVSIPDLSDQHYEVTGNIYGAKFLIVIILSVCALAGSLPKVRPNDLINYGVSSTFLLPIVCFLI